MSEQHTIEEARSLCLVANEEQGRSATFGRGGRNMRWFVGLIICAAIAIGGLPVVAVTYSRTDLGALGQYVDPHTGNPVSYSRVSGINNAGQLVGISSTSATQQVAPFVWTSSSGMGRMGNFTGPDYSPTGVTDSGKALFAARYSFTGGYYDMTSGAFTSMETDYSLVGLNENGRICANKSNGGYTFPKIKDQSGSWVDIDPVPNYAGLCRAVEMNESGQVCGTAYNRSTNGETAFLWNGPGNLIDIGAPAGYTISRSIGINDNGWVLGEAGRYLNDWWYFDTFIWRQGQGFTMVDTDSTTDNPVDINNSNQIVGFYQSGGTSWTWDAANGLTNLLNITAVAINDQGWIIGNSTSSAFLLQPVPEPSSIVALAGGLALAGMLRRRRR